MNKKVIILTGYPGAGKTTLSKVIESGSNFVHVEYDTHLNYDLNQPKDSNCSTTEHIIFDAVHFDTEKLHITLNDYKNNGYDITVVYLNIDKQICINNIINRRRPTIDIENVIIGYDFEELMRRTKFNLIQINNYKLDIENSKCVENELLFDHICKIIKKYEDTRTRNIVQNIGG